MESQENQTAKTTEPQPPVKATRPHRLRAGRAFTLFALFLAIQILTGIIVGFTLGIVAALQGANVQDPQVLAQVSQQATTLATISGFFLTSITVLYLATRWFPQEIHDGNMTGAAWRIGPPKFMVLGLGVGALIAVSYLFLSPLMSTPPDENTMGPFAKMATTPGLQQMLALFIALILAPPVEELLFRGVMFGGFCRSFGATWAAILTTSLFVASHLTEAIHFWPAFLFIMLMALAALWLRLQTKAIGPSIALHLAYNLIIFGVILLAPSS
ncbi:MAG: CPBP family intramembrane glutamic endopeptidase [Candidatus Electrothrix sp.]